MGLGSKASESATPGGEIGLAGLFSGVAARESELSPREAESSERVSPVVEEKTEYPTDESGPGAEMDLDEMR